MTQFGKYEWQANEKRWQKYCGWANAVSNGVTIYTLTGNQLGGLTTTTTGSVTNVMTYQYQYANRNQTLTSSDFYQSLMGNYYYQIQGNWVSSQPPETEAEKAARLKRHADREAAGKRAEALLFSILTPAQVKTYSDDGHFETEVNGRIYRIRKGVSRNVELIEGGKPKIKFCAHPQDAHNIPVPDVMLSQFLALRSNEAEFLRIANRTVLQ